MYTLDILNRLNDINADKDIKSLSHAVFPGTHCPLFGVILTASYIKNMALVVVGTSECTYYAKNFAYHRQEGLDSVYSVAIKESDVVFSAEKKVKQAIKQIIEFENPDAIMVVSTCVPEVIGEDYSSLSYYLEDEVDIPVFVVNTDHFTCNAHIPGMSRSLAVLSTAMKKFKDKKGINILGHRQKNVEETELIKLMKKHNITINAVIPSKCSIEDIQNASKAQLNIVTDMIALDLAKSMKKKFDIDYIYFDKHMDKETITKNYAKLSEILEVDFLSDLGLEPVFVQVRELYEQDVKHKENISKKGFNPYISRIANIAPLRKLYGSMDGDIYIGHENPMILKQHGLTQITLDDHAQKIGYELPIGIMETLIKILSLEKNTKREVMMNASM